MYDFDLLAPPTVDCAFVQSFLFRHMAPPRYSQVIADCGTFLRYPLFLVGNGTTSLMDLLTLPTSEGN